MAKAPELTTATELTEELCQALIKVKEAPAFRKQADTMANLAGKIIKNERLKMEHQLANDEKPQSDFLK